jgi:hypothetical protein
MQWGYRVMITEGDVARALDKPRPLFAAQQVINPGSKSTEELHGLLLRMRDAGQVKFDIKTGRWSLASRGATRPAPA